MNARVATTSAIVLCSVFAVAVSGCPRPVGPAARFHAMPRTGAAPLLVSFTDSSIAGSQPLTRWSWDFGDLGSSALQHPQHSYTVPGVYSVALTVTSTQGTSTYFEPGYVVVTGGGAASLVPVPDPLAAVNPLIATGAPAAPAAGVAIGDADLGLAQRRVTQTPGVRHEYSRHDPFNSDQSMILLLNVQEAGWAVYRTQQAPYDTAEQMVTALDLEEPRWDEADPNLIWGTFEFRILRVDVRQPGSPAVVKDFAVDPVIQPLLAADPDIYRITMKDEGEASRDRRFWAFILQGVNENYRARYLFTWDAQNDQVMGVHKLALSESNIDWVGMSPLGDWVLIGGMEDNTGGFAGLTMASKDFAQLHRLDFSTAHADVGLDADGHEVVVMQNVRTDYIDLIPIALTTQPILAIQGSYEGTNRIPLVRLYYSGDADGLSSGVHISCTYPGYCVVSSNIEQGLPAANWLDRKIILVRLDGTAPAAWYLAKVYGSVGAYWEETQASITADGTRVVWASNWGQDVGAERVWLMETELPLDW